MAQITKKTAERKLPSSKPADLAPHLIGTKGKVERPRPEAAAANEPLTFKVSPDFKQEVRRNAADHDLRLNQVLVRAFEALKTQQRPGPASLRGITSQACMSCAARATTHCSTWARPAISRSDCGATPTKAAFSARQVFQGTM